MPRKVVERPPEDLLAATTRLILQVNADTQLSGKRRKVILDALQTVSNELQNEIAKRG